MADDRTGDQDRLPGSDPTRPGFTPEVLDRTVIAVPLLRRLRAEEEGKEAAKVHGVIIDLNLDYPGGRAKARRAAERLIEEAIREAATERFSDPQGVNKAKSALSPQYLFAKLEGPVIRALVRLDDRIRQADPAYGSQTGSRRRAARGAIYRIWPDFPVRALTTESVRIVKADAARAAFSAFGEGIIWAVLDSGIDEMHPHFERHRNLKLPDPLRHRDFTATREAPLTDQFGHGTHVAGIIAGEMGTPEANGAKPTRRARSQPEEAILALTRRWNEHGDVIHETLTPDHIAGMAPRCKLLSLKVLDDTGNGEASNLIAAIAQIQEINGHGRRIRIHGVNMSVGYDFDPEWFACGQSPLCVEVDRLVRSGVVVVAAAGNTGYGWNATAARGSVASGMDLTINDPGNAELAITVGSTHRKAPHVYGVSYFSSKGPTGDGRLKPDLVAPGEKILSCAAGQKRAVAEAQMPATAAKTCGLYVEDSGTSMAAPHVSGVIAAFLSIRQEFVGRPETVKEIFLETATDLKRDRHFQGRGLVDLMRAIQSV